MVQTQHADTLIVGAGIFGASTAYHLSQTTSDPSSITVIDRTAPPPSPAASNDINKIIRADYSDPFYCDLAYEAMDAWSSWPELKPYYHRTGWVMLDEQDSDLAERVREVFRRRGHDPTSDIPLAEIGNKDHWGGCLRGTRTEGIRDAYWNPESGWCEAGNATAEMMNAAIHKGVKYVQGDVEKLVMGDGGIKGVQTQDGRLFTGTRILLATGAWTSVLLSPIEDALSIPPADRVEAQASAAGVTVAHYKLSASELEALSSMPVVVYGGNGEVIPPPPANNLLKFTNAHTFTNTITTPSGHRISVPPDRDQHIVSDKLKRETNEIMMSKVMPSFTQNKQADYWRICWDARTPSQDWLVSQHPDSRLSNLYLAVGGSFHSYKFLPNAGKYVVNVLSGKGNGEEKDRRWQWKQAGFSGRGAHEKTAPKRDLRDVEDSAVKL